MNALLSVDIFLMKQINTIWTNRWLDQTMPFITDLFRAWWVLCVILPVFLVIWFYKQRVRAFRVSIELLVALALSDGICFRLIKENVQRERPFNSLEGTILRTHIHYGYSFPSNHASNSFTAAVLVGLHYPVLRWYATVVAAVIAYSRVYVGVHFPSDVLAGALLGTLVAFAVFLFCRRTWPINNKILGRNL